ncbi:MAG: hypothetical protein EXS43_02040 [Opitutus sp.]|nr:hypothetical protein [Opitutus sp.]
MSSASTPPSRLSERKTRNSKPSRWYGRSSAHRPAGNAGACAGCTSSLARAQGLRLPVGQQLAHAGLRELERVKPVPLARDRGLGQRGGVEPGRLQRRQRRALEINAQAAPSLAVEPHELAARLEEQGDFRGRQRGILRAQREREVEPVAVRLGFAQLELHPRAHRPAEQRGEFTRGRHLDIRRERLAPRDEILGERPRDTPHPFSLEPAEGETERVELRDGRRDPAEVEGQDFAVRGRRDDRRQLAPTRRRPSPACGRMIGDRHEVDVQIFLSGEILRQMAFEARAQGDRGKTRRDLGRQPRPEAVQRLQDFGMLDDLGRHKRGGDRVAVERGRAAINDACVQVERGLAGQVKGRRHRRARRPSAMVPRRRPAAGRRRRSRPCGPADGRARGAKTAGRRHSRTPVAARSPDATGPGKGREKRRRPGLHRRPRARRSRA